MFTALNSNPDNLFSLLPACQSGFLVLFLISCYPILVKSHERASHHTRSCKSLPQCHRELETGRDTLTLKWLDSKAGMKFYSCILRVLYAESQWWSSLEIVLYIYWNSDGECLFSSTFGEKRTIPFGILKPSELRSLKLTVKRAVNMLLVSAFL